MVKWIARRLNRPEKARSDHFLLHIVQRNISVCHADKEIGMDKVPDIKEPKATRKYKAYIFDRGDGRVCVPIDKEYP